MINRRSAIGLLATAGIVGAAGNAIAKEKQHLDGRALLGEKIKQNGKHKIHRAGKADVFADVKGGKVVGVTAAGMQVKKVKSKQKLAGANSGLILTSTELAQIDVFYYGYWIYDPTGDYYYWFTSDVVIVDETWILI